MVLTQDAFLTRIRQVNYLQYQLCRIGKITFVTLYAAEEPEVYVLSESISEEAYAFISKQLQSHKRCPMPGAD